MPRKKSLRHGVVLQPNCVEDDEAMHDVRDVLGQTLRFEMTF